MIVETAAVIRTSAAEIDYTEMHGEITAGSG